MSGEGRERGGAGEQELDDPGRRFLSTCPRHDSFYRRVWSLTSRLVDWLSTGRMVADWLTVRLVDCSTGLVVDL